MLKPWANDYTLWNRWFQVTEQGNLKRFQFPWNMICKCRSTLLSSMVLESTWFSIEVQVTCYMVKFLGSYASRLSSCVLLVLVALYTAICLPLCWAVLFMRGSTGGLLLQSWKLQTTEDMDRLEAKPTASSMSYVGDHYVCVACCLLDALQAILAYPHEQVSGAPYHLI